MRILTTEKYDFKADVDQRKGNTILAKTKGAEFNI